LAFAECAAQAPSTAAATLRNAPADPKAVAAVARAVIRVLAGAQTKLATFASWVLAVTSLIDLPSAISLEMYA